MPAPRRLAAALAAAGVAALVAGCGDSGTSTSNARALSPGSTSTGCATQASACTLTGPTPVATAPAGGSTSGACTNPGSGRTDDFHQAVALHALADGLQVGDITVGTGPAVQEGQTATVAYSGWLQDGTLFDSSRKPGGQPFPVTVGGSDAIPGFEEAIATMHVGGVRRAVIPPQLGYGPGGNPPVIPPNATLTFDIEVLCAS